VKKIWSYIAMFALGLAAGIVAGVKLMGDQVSIEIKKIKTKKGTSEVTIPVNVEQAEKKLKNRRKDKSNKKPQRGEDNATERAKRRKNKQDGPESG